MRARNLAVQKAQGQWIACLDDDDWWPDDRHLAALATLLEQAPCLAYASGQLMIETDRQQILEILPFTAEAAGLDRDNRLLVPAIAYPRELHDRLGGFDETLPHYWDWDWYLRVKAAKIPFRKCGHLGACVSVRSDSVSSAARSAERQSDLARLVKKHALRDVNLKNHLSIARGDAPGAH